MLKEKKPYHPSKDPANFLFFKDENEIYSYSTNFYQAHEKRKIKEKKTHKKVSSMSESSINFSFFEAKHRSKFRKSNLPGTGYNSSHEFGGNRDWTFSKGCAAAFRSIISRKASLQVHKRK